MAYIIVDLIDIVSPVDEDLYEEVGSEYVLSSDEYPDPSKIYYMYDEEDEEEYGWFEVDVDPGDPVYGYYELEDGEYVLTEDIEAQAGKTYYDRYDPEGESLPYDEDDEYYAVEDTIAPFDEGLYEKTDDGTYILTEDLLPVDGKIYYAPIEEEDYEDIEEEEYAPVYSPDDVVSTGVFPYSPPGSSTLSDNYLYAKMQFVEDPSSEGLYEKADGVYVLTQDTTVVPGKVYYEYLLYSDYYVADMSGVSNPSMSLITYYELSGGSYIKTTDTTVSAQKTYYRSRIEDRYRYLPDPSKGLTPATWDDIPYEE